MIAYSFETGADRFGATEQTTVSVAAAVGATGMRVGNRNLFTPLEGDDRPGPPDRGASARCLRCRRRTRRARTRTCSSRSSSSSRTSGGQSCADITLTQQGVGFQPPYDTEGRFEAPEFSAGNYGLLESAYEYSKDDKGPEVIMTGVRSSSTPITTTFQYVTEPAVIRYTTDGSKPDNNSALWDSTGPREPGETFVVSTTTEFRWLATDMAGNQTTGRATFEIK